LERNYKRRGWRRTRKPMPKMKASQFLKELVECKDCKANFDGKGGFEMCDKHFKILKKTPWLRRSES